MLSEMEYTIADRMLNILLYSEKYQNKNILFIEPFDINEVPDYLSTIGTPIDVRTIANRFYNNNHHNTTEPSTTTTTTTTTTTSSNYYTTMTDFWNDIYRVYNNAIQYHNTNKSNSKWIAKFAKDMIKIIHKERKMIEQKVLSSGSNNATTTTSSNSNSNGNSNSSSNSSSSKPTPEYPTSSSNNNNNTNITGLKNSGANAPSGSNNYNNNSKPKTKIKWQLPTTKSSSVTTAAAAVVVGDDDDDGTSMMLDTVTSASSGLDETITAAGMATTATTTKKQFKLKLKLTKSPSSTTSNNNDLSSSTSSSHKNSTTDGKNNPTPPKKQKGATIAKKTLQQQHSSNNKLKLKISLSKPNTTVDDDDDMEDGEVVMSPPLTTTSSPAVVVVVVPPVVPTQQKVKVATPRGKELPQGVVVAPPSIVTSSNSTTGNAMSSNTAATLPSNNVKKVTAVSKKSKKLPVISITADTITSTSGVNVSAGGGGGGGGGLDPFQIKQCYKVLYGLKRRKTKQVYWFLSPVSDKNILLDYKSKIKYPMDLSTIQTKLDKQQYKKMDAFVFDLRRIFANALRYNTSIKDSLRPLAVEGLQCTEQLLLMFLVRHFNSGNHNNNGNNTGTNNSTPYPSLLYCWNVCINILDTLYNLVNPLDGQPMAYYFLYPVSVYCGGKFPPDYLELVKKPMDFGTITANLIEGRYQTTESFSNDCRLVVQNCQTYYQGKEESRVFLDQALRLNECLTTQLSQLARYDKSMKGESERRKLQQLISNPIRIAQEMILPNQPPIAIYLNAIEEIRTMKYTDKGTKITEPAMTPFEKPVSLSDHPDYLQYVSEPIDLQMIERKIKSNDYETPEDFEYDMNLLFKNCEIYNTRRNAQHPVAMSKFAQRKFRNTFYTKMQQYEDPTSMLTDVPSSTTQPSTEDSTSTTGPSPSKKIKIDLNAASSKGKTAPRISISASLQSGNARAKSPSTVPQSSSSSLPVAPRQVMTIPKPKIDAPVPLHIAIAKVKETFPLRRAVKSLQVWEADCARYHKELMRHIWISAARPKFVFNCPVPILFPELSEHYAAKIRRPMDLTTIECTLLAGNRYAGPEDFVQDVALVFANAIRFNKEGKDIGDPLSCAYYDASVHLLKYSRWLSLDLLAPFIEESDHIDTPTSDGLPPFAWKLTTGNRQLARQEVEDLVMNEPIEKSLEGDRYSWMEAECEKLLKALRHQSDLRYMSFFIQPNYPVDYTAFISKPMDWERVQRTLKKRHYDTIGALIGDMRLIFTNAEKYNSRLKGTDTVSGLAYEAANIMSKKLEVAINKLLLTVSDRLERERIDHSNAEREIDAAERAEEAEIRAAWNKQELSPFDKDNSIGTVGSRLPTSSSTSSLLPPGSSMRPDLSQRMRMVRRMSQQRTNFEVPFFEDDDGYRYRSSSSNNNNTRSLGDNEAMKVQKTMFERQRYELNKMRSVSVSIGTSVFVRMLERQVMDQEEWQRQQQQQQQQQSESTPGITDVSMSDAPVDHHDDVGSITDATTTTTTTTTTTSAAAAAAYHQVPAPSSVLATLEQEGRGLLQIKFVAPVMKKRKRSTAPTLSIPDGF